MPGPMPGIHVLLAASKKDVDARAKRGHDAEKLCVTIPFHQSSAAAIIAMPRRLTNQIAVRR